MSRSDARMGNLQLKLDNLYMQLAKAPQMEEKEQEQLYKDIDRLVEKLNRQEEISRQWASFLHDSTDELEARKKDTIKSTKKGFILSPAPSNGTIDYREEATDHFARGTNFYKLFLILFIGSFAGVVVELLWCFIRHGYFESRSGLVWGPFNLVYGLGALCLSMTLYRYRNRSAIHSFIGGFITGSVVEYLCSFFQELVFGSTSWDYSNVPFNINGRICLLYSIFWGFLGVFWIKSLMPRMSVWILAIPNRIGKALVWVLFVFMLLNAIVSAGAVYRWSQRIGGTEATNAVERVLDQRFPDERMERIFPNLVFQE